MFLAVVILHAMAAVVQLNHTGASPSLPQVLQVVQAHQQLEAEVGGYAAAAKMPLEPVYESLAQLLEATPEEIGLTAI